MTSELKPITLWGGVLGPNPSKVGMILTELNVPFVSKYVPFHDIKGPEYVKINPNGRLPAIEDPNRGITIWESGAIIEYLISEYDHDHTLSFPTGSTEEYHVKQWLYFQVSGQGPYYGQANVSLLRS
jgi:glutathione S-transferase